MGSPPTTFRTLPGLSEGQTPVFAMCPAHAGTGATTTKPPSTGLSCVRPTRAQGQLLRNGIRSAPPAVRPTRAQGQRPQHHHPDRASRPAHAGTGATLSDAVERREGDGPAHAGTGPQRVRQPMPAKTSRTAPPPEAGASGGGDGVGPPTWGGACRSSGGRRWGPSGPPSPGPPAQHQWQGWGQASRGKERGIRRVPRACSGHSFESLAAALIAPRAAPWFRASMASRNTLSSLDNRRAIISSR